MNVYVKYGYLTFDNNVDPPKFECERDRYVELYTEKFTLDCKISGNPVVELEEVFWLIGDVNVTSLTIGESKDGFSANATVWKLLFLLALINNILTYPSMPWKQAVIVVDSPITYNYYN